MNPRRIAEPHRFGEYYRVVAGSLEQARGFSKQWRANGVLCRHWVFEEFSVTVKIGSRVQTLEVWLKAFRGLSPNQQVVRGRMDLRNFAADFAGKWGASVKFHRYAGELEWTTTVKDAGLTRAMTDGMKLRKRSALVGDILHKRDKSHPAVVEMRRVKQDLELSVTEFEQRYHDLIYGNAPGRLAALENAVERVLKTQSKLNDLVLDRLKQVESRQEGGAIEPIPPGERRDVL